MAEESTNQNTVTDVPAGTNNSPVNDTPTNSTPDSEPANTTPANDTPTENPQDPTTEPGYGGNDSEEGGAITYENGEWSGVIVDPEQPKKEQPEQEQPSEKSIEEPTPAPVKRIYTPIVQNEASAEISSDNETIETEKEEAEPLEVAYLEVEGSNHEASADISTTDTRMLAHLTTALIVSVAVMTMIICNLYLKPKKMKIIKLNAKKSTRKKKN